MRGPGWIKRWVRLLAVLMIACFTASALAVPVSGQGTWETELKARDISGNPLASLSDPAAVFYYDTTLNITWLRDWNSPFRNWTGTDQFGTQGAMEWAASININGFTGWRLPAVQVPDPSCSDNQSFALGFNCTGSELGHMWYVTLGMTGSTLLPGPPFFAQLPAQNSAEFINMNFTRGYWFNAQINSFQAYDFSWNQGRQGATQFDNGTILATAVRPGDVIPQVPEPGSLALIGLALAGLGWGRRKN